MPAAREPFPPRTDGRRGKTSKGGNRGKSKYQEQILTGVKIGHRTDKNHPDRYNQTALREGEGPPPATNYSVAEVPNLGRCGWTTSNTSSIRSRRVGPDRKLPLTCLCSS